MRRVGRSDTWSAERDAVIGPVLRLVRGSEAPMFAVTGPEDRLVTNPVVDRLLGLTAATDDVRLRDVPAWAGILTGPVERVRAGATVTIRKTEVPRGHAGEPGRWVDLVLSPLSDVQGETRGALCAVSDVTERAQRHDDTATAVQRLGLVTEGTGVAGFWTYDDATGQVGLDDALTEWFGLRTASQRGFQLLNTVHPHDRDRVLNSFRAAITNGLRFRIRCRVRVPGHGYLVITVSAVRIAVGDGGDARMLGTVIEHTDGIPANGPGQEPTFRFRALTEALPQIVWSADADGRHDYFSARWYEFTGVLQEHATERTWTGLVHPQDWAQVDRRWARSLRLGEPYDIVYRFRHHSGQFRWLRVMALPARDEQGRIVRWCGTATDIDEAYRSAQEQERRATELERVATEDLLTGTLTRRAFSERADEILSAPATSGPATLLLIDIDHFKLTNDTHGHAVGDTVLAATARRLVHELGARGLIGRWGGEEFIVLLPACSRLEGLGVSERLRRAVAAGPVPTPDGLAVPVTISVGCHTSTAPTRLDRMTAFADDLLYRAKALGRNRCVAGSR